MFKLKKSTGNSAIDSMVEELIEGIYTGEISIRDTNKQDSAFISTVYRTQYTFDCYRSFKKSYKATYSGDMC